MLEKQLPSIQEKCNQLINQSRGSSEKIIQQINN